MPHHTIRNDNTTELHPKVRKTCFAKTITSIVEEQFHTTQSAIKTHLTRSWTLAYLANCISVS